MPQNKVFLPEESLSTMSDQQIRVLYVDDEQNNLFSFKAIFRTDFHVTTAISAAEALKKIEKEEFHVIVTDQRMPEMTGVEFLESILETYPLPVRILLTGYTDINAVIDAVNKGKIFHYLNKPWDEEELRSTIITAYDLYKAREEQKDITQKLTHTNEQLEFLLRQNLIS